MKMLSVKRRRGGPFFLMCFKGFYQLIGLFDRRSLTATLLGQVSRQAGAFRSNVINVSFFQRCRLVLSDVNGKSEK